MLLHDHRNIKHYLRGNCEQILRWDDGNHIAIDALAWVNAGCLSQYSNQDFDICSAVDREYKRLEQTLTLSEVFSFCLNALNALAEESCIDPLTGKEPPLIIAHEEWSLHYAKMIDVDCNAPAWVFNTHATAACSEIISTCLNCYIGA